MSISAVQNHNIHTKYTKTGNQYQKTNAAKAVGTAVGAACAGVIINDKKTINGIVSRTVDACKTCLPEFSKNTAMLKKGAKIGGVFGIAATAPLAGFAVGTIVDGVVNKIKAHKADKKA